MDGLLRSFETPRLRPRDVANVHDGPPRRTVALDVHSAGGVRPRHQVVQNHIQPQARRSAVSGRISEIGRAETLIRQRRHVALDQDLGFGIRRYRVQRQPSRPADRPRRHHRCCTRTRRQSADPCLFGQLGQADGSAVIDIVGEVPIEVAQGVIRQRGQMHHRVETLEIGFVRSRRSLRISGISGGASPKSQPSNRSVSRPTTSWPAARKIGPPRRRYSPYVQLIVFS